MSEKKNFLFEGLISLPDQQPEEQENENLNYEVRPAENRSEVEEWSKQLAREEIEFERLTGERAVDRSGTFSGRLIEDFEEIGIPADLRYSQIEPKLGIPVRYGVQTIGGQMLGGGFRNLQRSVVGAAQIASDVLKLDKNY